MLRRAAGVALLVALVGAPGVAGAQETSWTWPLAGPYDVSRPFAPPATRYGAGHRGADLPGAAGLPVRAAGAGRVSYAGLLAGRGVIVVSHGNLRTTYEPVTASVAVGTVVTAGQEIGRLDAAHSGCPVAACLHWGLRRGEAYLDPVQLVDRRPAQLLPLGDAAQVPMPVPDGQSAGIAPATAPVPEPEPAAVGSSAAGDPARQASEEPAWSLRAAQAPLGLAAVVALLAGIGLRARRRPGPKDPATGGATVVPAQESGPDAQVWHLEAERLRRRAG